MPTSAPVTRRTPAAICRATASLTQLTGAAIGAAVLLGAVTLYQGPLLQSGEPIRLGIPLAIVLPDAHFALIESTGKKCRFLEHVRDTLALTNVEVVQARAEAHKPTNRYDTVLARAVGPVADLVRNAGPLVAGGGRLLAMKGRFPEDELAKKLSGWKVAAVHRLAVPGLDEERHLAILARD